MQRLIKIYENGECDVLQDIKEVAFWHEQLEYRKRKRESYQGSAVASYIGAIDNRIEEYEDKRRTVFLMRLDEMTMLWLKR